MEPGHEGWRSTSTVHPTVTSTVLPDVEVMRTIPVGTEVGVTVVGVAGVVVTVVGVTVVGVTAVVVGGTIPGDVDGGEAPPDPPGWTVV